METFFASLAICAGNSAVPGEFHAQRPVTRSFDIFFICVWINDWENNREAGDSRRYRAYCDVIVMFYAIGSGYDHSVPFAKTMGIPQTYSKAPIFSLQDRSSDKWSISSWAVIHSEDTVLLV